jgi:signal transduction histidine kinase
MNNRSLRLRLMVLASSVISVILIFSGLVFYWLFQRHVEKFVMAELNTHFEHLAAGLSLKKDGSIDLRDKGADPRFQVPGGGLYWQIDVKEHPSLRSRSLWDSQLDVPTPPDGTEENHAHIMPLPFGGEIFALEKLVTIENDTGKEANAVVTVGLDRQRVTDAAATFAREIIVGLAVVYAALLLGSLAMIMLGLKPLQRLRDAVAKANAGDAALPTGEFPSEVLPLVEEINALTQARRQQLDSARKRASNLAHGLKTPLTVLSAVASELATDHQTDAAQTINANTQQMRDLVERELARTRMSDGSRSYRAKLDLIVASVINTMKRAPRGDELTWSIEVPKQAIVQMDATDLLELVGNLSDNARKYARSMVRLSHDGNSFVVEDDGPGVDDSKLGSIMARGVRLDQSKSDGQGIGLSIVKDLADVYQLKLTAEKSVLGGLALRIALPLAPARKL